MFKCIRSWSEYWASNKWQHGFIYHPIYYLLLIFPLSNCSIQKPQPLEQLPSNILIWNSQTKKYIFPFKKKKERRKKAFNFTWQTRKIWHCFNISITLRRYMNVELTSKKPKVWWVILFDEKKEHMLFLTKLKEQPHQRL